MEEKGPTKQTAPPYVSFKTFKSFLAGLQVTMPSRIDRSVMHNFSGAVKTQLTHALKALSLVDGGGIPREMLTRLVNSEGAERATVLRAVLQQGYPYLFDADFDIRSGTASQLIQKFAKAGATGDTARKAITFFLDAAKEASLQPSPYFKKAGAQARGNRKAASNGASSNGASSEGAVPPSPKVDRQEEKAALPIPPAPPPSESMGWAQLLLSKFPSFDPAWPDDVKAKWFDAFDRLMKTKEG